MGITGYDLLQSFALSSDVIEHPLRDREAMGREFA